MSVAILFKTHFWDEDVREAFRACLNVSEGFDVFICLDITHGIPVVDSESVRRARGIRHDSRDSLIEAELCIYPEDNPFWWNVDYPAYLFYKAFPEYEYYMMLEHDARITISIAAIIEQMRRHKADLLSYRSVQPVEEWEWTNTCEGYYRQDEILSHLLCVSVMSHRAVVSLFKGRVRQAKAREAAFLEKWPFSEAFVPSEAKRNDFGFLDLRQIGATGNYKWWPPMLSSDLRAYDEPGFVHPVLGRERYIRSLLHYGDLLSVFDHSSLLSLKLRRCDHGFYADKLAHRLREKDLTEAAERIDGWASAFGSGRASEPSAT